jgi:hypothetical protein
MRKERRETKTQLINNDKTQLIRNVCFAFSNSKCNEFGTRQILGNVFVRRKPVGDFLTFHLTIKLDSRCFPHRALSVRVSKAEPR